MTDPALIERITRSLAFMLRHQPEKFDLELDAQGFADLGDVVHALNERLGEPVEDENVIEAVRSGDRPRYEIQDNRIRALYGHSIPIEPGPSSRPPDVLYVAVPEQEVERARRFGLRGGRRRFLHLATSRDDACESGRRASRDYTVLLIRALDAWEEGIHFYDRTALWLAEEIPTHLIEVEGVYHDGTEPPERHREGPRERGHRERGYRDRDQVREGRAHHGESERERPQREERQHAAHGGGPPLEREQGGDRGGDGGRHRRRGGRGRRDRGRDRGERGGREHAPARADTARTDTARTDTARTDTARNEYSSAPARERPARERIMQPAPEAPRTKAPARSPLSIPERPFGAGLDSSEEARGQPRTPPPPPPPRPPAPRPEERHDEAGGSSFGAGL